MKKPTRATVTQFETALVEQTRHSQSLNIPANAIASAFTFCVLIGNRLYGERTSDQRSAEFKATYEQVISNARREREEFQEKQRELERQERDRREQERSRIVLPGQIRQRN